jgi:adenylylsulfate kinase
MQETGAVVWITGLPSSGKSLLARRLCERLTGAGRPPILLDGDDIRHALAPSPGYGDADRDAFYLTLAQLAALFAGQGHIAVVAATTHRASFRERARHLFPRLVEVFVDVDIFECHRRDAKGLYAAVDEGRASEVPGADLPYEIPSAPDAVARGGMDSVALDRIQARLNALTTPQPAAEDSEAPC